MNKTDEKRWPWSDVTKEGMLVTSELLHGTNCSYES